MFDSLKSKMKNLFSRANKKLDEEKIYKDEPAVEQTPAPVTEKPETTSEPPPPQNRWLFPNPRWNL